MAKAHLKFKKKCWLLTLFHMQFCTLSSKSLFMVSCIKISFKTLVQNYAIDIFRTTQGYDNKNVYRDNLDNCTRLNKKHKKIENIFCIRRHLVVKSEYFHKIVEPKTKNELIRLYTRV